MDLEALLMLAGRAGASDLHLTVNSPPILRVNGQILPLDAPELDPYDIPADWKRRLSPEDLWAAADRILDQRRMEHLRETGEYDFSYSVAGLGRFRVNIYKQRGSVALAVRPVRTDIPSLTELGLPEHVSRFVRMPHGLVLVTGPTGSGKSTTLAAFVDLLNNTVRKHIITIEDPIEYVHRHKKCIVNQREVGQDTLSFSAALRAAMREDPDVIVVGEMRDLETVGAAITAAETGHLVFATLHTASAAQTIDRIIDIFPPHQQRQVRVQTANVLQGVVAQRLLTRRDRPGRVLAVEVMYATPAVRNLIRENKTHQIATQLQTGGRFGMQTMEMSLLALYRQGIISRDDALEYATDPESLARLL